MKSLLQALAWYADTVLSICWPEPEGLPSLEDAAALAEQEAQEEVAEPQCVCCDEVGSGGRVDPGDVWPEQPDPLGHIVALLEDIHNILQGALHLTPPITNLAPVELPADPERSNLANQADYLFDVVRRMADHADLVEWMSPYRCGEMAMELNAIAVAVDPRSKCQ